MVNVCVQVVPCVEGIYFKDLKQTLKKEQCDVSLFFTLFILLVNLHTMSAYTRP
jgi:hypothetical protein